MYRTYIYLDIYRCRGPRMSRCVPRRGAAPTARAGSGGGEHDVSVASAPPGASTAHRGARPGTAENGENALKTKRLRNVNF